MTDIRDELQERADSYRLCGQSGEHTAELLERAKIYISSLLLELEQNKIDIEKFLHDREEMISAYMDGYEMAKDEYRPRLIEAEDKIDELVSVLKLFVTKENCIWDNGYCWVHASSAPCPNETASKLIRELE